MLDRALHLVKEGDAQNEVQILRVVPAHGQPVLGVGQERLKRVHHGQRSEQALKGVMAGNDGLALFPAPQSLQRVAVALGFQYRPGLLGRLVNAGHDKTTARLGVQVGLRRGLKDGGGAGDGVYLRGQLAG